MESPVGEKQVASVTDFLKKSRKLYKDSALCVTVTDRRIKKNHAVTQFCVDMNKQGMEVVVSLSLRGWGVCLEPILKEDVPHEAWLQLEHLEEINEHALLMLMPDEYDTIH